MESLQPTQTSLHNKQNMDAVSWRKYRQAECLARFIAYDMPNYPLGRIRALDEDGQWRAYKIERLTTKNAGIYGFMLLGEQTNPRVHIVFRGTHDFRGIHRDVEYESPGFYSYCAERNDILTQVDKHLAARGQALHAAGASSRIHVTFAGHSLGGVDIMCLANDCLEVSARAQIAGVPASIRQIVNRAYERAAQYGKKPSASYYQKLLKLLRTHHLPTQQLARQAWRGIAYISRMDICPICAPGIPKRVTARADLNAHLMQILESDLNIRHYAMTGRQDVAHLFGEESLFADIDPRIVASHLFIGEAGKALSARDKKKLSYLLSHLSTLQTAHCARYFYAANATAGILFNNATPQGRAVIRNVLNRQLPVQYTDYFKLMKSLFYVIHQPMHAIKAGANCVEEKFNQAFQAGLDPEIIKQRPKFRPA